MKSRGEALRAFLVAIVTALITILGVTVSEVEGPVSRERVLLVGYTLIVLASLSLLVLIGSSFVLQYIEIAKEIEGDEILKKSIPTLVRFRSRTDVFSIDSEGRVTLDWNFEIEKGSRERCVSLDFPIIAEDRGFITEPISSNPMPALPVHVASVIVDGEDKTDLATLMFEERRSLLATRRNLDYSRLAVPVRLEGAKSTTRVQIRLVFERTVGTGANVGSAIVDVPYVTDRLRVEVHHDEPTSAIVPPVNSSDEADGRPILATSAMMGFTDSRETEVESDNLSAEHGSLIWRTRAPKLGYRYKINYRVIGSTNPLPDRRPPTTLRNVEDRASSASLEIVSRSI